jgi:hypothetical protein
MLSKRPEKQEKNGLKQLNKTNEKTVNFYFFRRLFSYSSPFLFCYSLSYRSKSCEVWAEREKTLSLFDYGGFSPSPKIQSSHATRYFFSELDSLFELKTFMRDGNFLKSNFASNCSAFRIL